MIRFILLLVLLSVSRVVLAQSVEIAESTIDGVGIFTLPSITQGIAGDQVTFNASLIAEQDLGPGSSIVIAGHWGHPTRLQNSDPAAPGYVEVSGEFSTAFTAIQVQRDGVYGGMETVVSAPGFLLTDIAGHITTGKRISFRLHNVTLPGSVTRSFRIAAVVNTSQGLAVERLSEAVRVTAGSFKELNLIADSIVRPGEDVDLRLRMEDEFGNLARDRQLSLDLLVNGTYRNRVQLENAYSSIPGVSFDIPGVYVVEVRSGGGGLTARSNPIVVRGAGAQVVWADLGQRTILSTGIQSENDLLASNMGVYDLTITADYPGKRSADYQPEDMLQLVYDGSSALDVALAEGPSDVRFPDPESFRLTQVLGPESDYTWLGNAVARRGYRTGFVAVNQTHQRWTGEQRSMTAILVQPGETAFNALASGRTYVTTGHKTVLIPHQHSLTLGETRKLGIDVFAGEPIADISLFKNGKRISSHQTTAEGAGIYRLTLSADNSPLSGLETRPRNRREWIGFLQTRDSPITVSVKPEKWQVIATGNRRLDFLTSTHGLDAVLDFQIGEPTPDTVIEMVLAPIVEDAAWLPEDRLPQQIPVQRFLIPWRELEAGAERSFDAAGYRDSIRIGPAVQDVDNNAVFVYTDNSEGRVGDYYYFRVTLASGGIAMTSPIFVEKSPAGVHYVKTEESESVTQ